MPHRGYRQTAEHQAKIAAAIRTPEVQARMRSFWTPERRSQAAKRGWATMSSEVRAERLRRLAEVAPKSFSLEQRENHRAAMNRPEVRAKLRENHVGMTGKTRSVEFRTMMGAAVSEARAKGNYGLHPNGNERRLYAYLRFLALEFKSTPTVRVVNYCVDAFVEPNLVFEADGSYWHGSKESKEYDAKRDADLRVAGYIVVRYSEQHLKQVEEVLTRTKAGRKALSWAEELKKELE